MPTPSQFKVLIAVAETGGIHPAAEKIGRTPSAISMTLKQIEAEIGGALFEGNRKVRLTGLGAFVVDQGRSLIEHNDRAHRTISAFARNGSGEVDVAMLPSIAWAFLPEALKTMGQDGGHPTIRIRDLDSSAIHESVLREVVDWGVALHRPIPDLVGTPLFSEPLSIVCAEGDPLCRQRGPIAWEALSQRVFIANGSYAGLQTPEFRAIEEKSHMFVRSVLSLLATVRAGVGITVLPSLSRVQGSEGLRFLPIADPRARRVVHLLTRKDRNISPAARQFADILQVTIAQHANRHKLTMLSSKQISES
jgi:DNA-binding transcriptional LysR family regulator